MKVDRKELRAELDDRSHNTEIFLDTMHYASYSMLYV